MNWVKGFILAVVMGHWISASVHAGVDEKPFNQFQILAILKDPARYFHLLPRALKEGGELLKNNPKFLQEVARVWTGLETSSIDIIGPVSGRPLSFQVFTLQGLYSLYDPITNPGSLTEIEPFSKGSALESAWVRDAWMWMGRYLLQMKPYDEETAKILDDAWPHLDNRSGVSHEIYHQIVEGMVERNKNLRFPNIEREHIAHLNKALSKYVTNAPRESDTVKPKADQTLTEMTDGIGRRIDRSFAVGDIYQHLEELNKFPAIPSSDLEILRHFWKSSDAAFLTKYFTEHAPALLQKILEATDTNVKGLENVVRACEQAKI